MQRLLFLGVLCLCSSVARSEQTDTTLRMQQQTQYQQKLNEQQTVEKDRFLTQGQINQQERVIYDMADLVMGLFLAINHKQTSDIERLLQIYEQSPEAESGLVLFAQANIALNNQEFRKAIALYEQLVAEHPDFDRGMLDLARLYFVDYQNIRANHLFNQLYLPPDSNVYSHMQQFKNLLQKRHAWQGFLSVGGLYNDNINQTSAYHSKEEQIYYDPNSQQYQVVKTSTSDKVQAFGWSYEASLNKNQQFIDQHSVNFQSYVYGYFYPKAAQFDEHNATFKLGYQFQNRTIQWTLSPLFEMSMIGHQRYTRRVGLSTELGVAPTAYSFLYLATNYKKERYYAEHYQPYNNEAFSIFMNGVYLFDKDWMLTGGGDYLIKLGMKDPSDEYHQISSRIGVHKSFDSGGSMSLNLTLRNIYYHASHSVLNIKRKDQEQIYRAKIQFKPLTENNLVPSVYYQHTRHKSNIDWLYSYQKNEVGLSVSLEF